jgi:hypothetical protein
LFNYALERSLEDNISNLLYQTRIADTVPQAIKLVNDFTIMAEWNGTRVDLRKNPSLIDLIRENRLLTVQFKLASRESSARSSKPI